MTILLSLAILALTPLVYLLLVGHHRYGTVGLMDLAAAWWLTLRDCLRFRQLQRVEMRRFRAARMREYRAALRVERRETPQEVVEVD